MNGFDLSKKFRFLLVKGEGKEWETLMKEEGSEWKGESLRQDSG